MGTILPESFFLPTTEDYDNLVDGLDNDIREEKGAKPFLGIIRSERRNNRSFYDTVLMPAYRTSMLLEERDPETKLAVHKEHKLANAALSGMLFGNLMNEGFYSNFNQKYQPYHNLFVYDNMLGQQKDAYMSAGRTETLDGRRIGYRAMANFVLNQFSDASIMKVDSWSDELIQNPEYKPYFYQGIGMALFSAWDVYSDLLVKDGRSDDVHLTEDLLRNT